MVEEPVLILSIGCPGSGKSTLFKALNKSKKYESAIYLSADDLRIFSQEGRFAIIDPSKEKEVMEIYLNKFQDAIAHRKDILLDRTHLTKKNRSQYIESAKFRGYKIIIYYFDICLETCLAQNQLRTKQCPEEHIKKCFKKIEPPEIKECNFIITIGDHPWRRLRT